MESAEAELTVVKNDLVATCDKFDAARRELITRIVTRKRELLQAAKDKETAKVADQNLCCICMEAAKSILLLPCRHLCVCEVCSQGSPLSPERLLRGSAAPRRIQSCPVCRAAVAECLKVFA